MSKLFLLLSVIMMDLLTGMEFDLFVPSFPELQSLFDISSFWVEALLSVNFIGYCLSLFFVGAFSDRYGRKPILLIGLSLFVAGSLLCVFAPTFGCLLIGRFLQGIGVAAPSILSFLIIADSYPLSEQQRFMALLNGVMNIAVGLAPVAGSYIALYFHWQGNFIALLLLGLLVLMMTCIFIPHYPLPKSKKQSLISGYVELLSSKPLMLLIGHIILMIVPYWIFVGMSPLLYIKALGVSLTHFGYYQGSLALVFALGCFVFSWFLNQLQQKIWLILSVYTFIVSLVSLGLTTLVNSTNPLLITLSLFPFIVGQIIPSTILYPLCLHYKPEAKGQVSAMIQGGRLILCAITLQIAGFYYRGSFQNIGIIIIAVISLVVFTLILLLNKWKQFENSYHTSTLKPEHED
ncbi:major facilitator superfamily (MFS) transporter [Legionella santicrucis]|uniref:Major facilitator superfamily (MFS) transporter n=1 Tax=Legionella santicrucis TaxID=45074 RepID=A0A0W0Y931_9GAMM|nr:MFS transporter [Legionella santicrucis]KTD53467.1 major facilitator superfamily (MFS) transporter [Legionella santicrucis]